MQITKKSADNHYINYELIDRFDLSRIESGIFFIKKTLINI